MNAIKSTGFVAAGVGLGLLAAHLYYSSSEASAPEPESSAVLGATTTAEPSPVYSATDLPTSRARPIRPAFVAHPLPEASLAQQQADARATQLRLDGRLRAEPVNSKWASEQEATILAAISGDPNDGLPARLPKDMDAQCHSNLCKVTMTFTDEEDAYQMQTKLTLGLRGPIAAARTFYNQRADGGMDLVIYAGHIADSR